MIDAIVIVPPPTTGQTLVTEMFCRAIGTARPLRLWAIRNKAGHRGVRWTLVKHGSIFKTMLRLAILRRGRGVGYIVPDSGSGLWLNLVEAFVMRLAFREVWLHHHVFSYVRRHDRRMALLLRILGSRVHHIVLGEAMAEGLAQHYGAQAIYRLGNASFVRDVPPSRVHVRPETIGFLGNITRDKGIDLFMDTMQRVQSEDPGIVCHIAGPIRDPELRADVEAFCAQNPARRQWLGPVQGADKEAFFKKVDVLLFPSLYPNEALPVTIYEALAAGLPVLATTRGCIPGQLSGLDACLPDDSFAEQAAARILAWAAAPESFLAASRAAIETFAARREEDECSLAQLIHVMGGLATGTGAAAPLGTDHAELNGKRR